MVKRCKNKINVGDNPPEGVAAPVGEEAGNGEANDDTETISVCCRPDQHNSFGR